MPHPVFFLLSLRGVVMKSKVVFSCFVCALVLVLGSGVAHADAVDDAIVALNTEAARYIEDAIGAALGLFGGLWILRVAKRAEEAAS